MHCAICDREDDMITFDKLTGKYSDCLVCQAVIAEALEDFEETDESESPVDYTEGGRGSGVYSSGVQPEGTTRRPFCETYRVSTNS